MSSYNLGFAKQINRAAELVATRPVSDFDEAQAIAYMNLVAIEIAMKAMLEKAGWDVTHLRRRSHNLGELLADLSQTEILEPGCSKYKSAAKIRSIGVTDTNGAKGTLGKIIDAENQGASRYPNELRYGDNFRHFSPAVLTAAARAVIEFAGTYWNSFRKKTPQASFIQQPTTSNQQPE